MLSRSELNKIALAQSAFKYKNVIDEAEAIYKEQPEWMVRRLAKLNKRIKSKALSGGEGMFTLGWFSFAFRTKNKLAMAIAMCEAGYYITMDDPMIYLSWNWNHSGMLKFRRKLERRQGGSWNIDEVKLSDLYNSLAREKDNA